MKSAHIRVWRDDVGLSQELPPCQRALIEPHEAQAKRNHGNQTLDELAERSGLNVAEVVAILEDRLYWSMKTEQAVARYFEILQKSHACPFAKSDMTPCVIHDGNLAYALTSKGVKICVGCERTAYRLGLPEPSDLEEKARRTEPDTKSKPAPEPKMPEWRDLGLTYEQAGHAVQTAVAYEMSLAQSIDGGDLAGTTPKHLRVGLNTSKSDHGALAYLLIRKGLISEAEYREALRLALNDEVARYGTLYPGITFR